MVSEHFIQIEEERRRRIFIAVAARMIATTGLLIVVYYALPLKGFESGSAIVLLAGSAVAFVLVLVWQVRRIVGAPYPELRVIESFAVIVPLLIVLFSAIYVKMGSANPGSFTQPMTHTGALYFTTTVLATVGFGDITPVTDSARLVVMLQMLLDLVLLGTLVKLLFGAAKRGVERRQPGDDEAAAEG